MHGLPLKQFFPGITPSLPRPQRKVPPVNMRSTAMPRSARTAQHKSWAMTPPTLEKPINYHTNTPSPKPHMFSSMVAPGDRRASLMRPPRMRHDKPYGSKLNCYMRGHGGNGPIRVYYRDRNGMLTKTTDC